MTKREAVVSSSSASSALLAASKNQYPAWVYPLAYALEMVRALIIDTPFRSSHVQLWSSYPAPHGDPARIIPAIPPSSTVKSRHRPPSLIHPRPGSDVPCSVQ